MIILANILNIPLYKFKNASKSITIKPGTITAPAAGVAVGTTGAKDAKVPP
jgi:hypothetical protein